MPKAPGPTVWAARPWGDDRGIRAREEEVLTSGVTPPDHVGRLTILVTDFEHLAVAIGLAHPTSTDDDPISNLRLHRDSLRQLHPHGHDHPITAPVQGDGCRPLRTRPGHRSSGSNSGRQQELSPDPRWPVGRALLRCRLHGDDGIPLASSGGLGQPLSMDIDEARSRFHDLHEQGTFLMPNPFDRGSCRLLDDLGSRPWPRRVAAWQPPGASWT